MQYWTLRGTSSDRLPNRPCDNDLDTIEFDIQSVLCPLAVIQCTLPEFVYDDFVRDCESLSEGRQYPLFSPHHPGCCFIIEIFQIGQAWFTFSESVLTAPDHLLSIQTGIRVSRLRFSVAFPGIEMIGSSLCSSSCPFWRPVTFAFFQSSSRSPQLHHFSKMMMSSLTVISTICLSTQGCILPGPMELWMSSLPREF